MSSSPHTSTKPSEMSKSSHITAQSRFVAVSKDWGFTVRQFAVKYAKKFGVDKAKMMERLWVSFDKNRFPRLIS